MPDFTPCSCQLTQYGSLELTRTDSSIAVPANPFTIFTWDNVVTDTASIYRGGIFTAPFTGTYTFLLQFNPQISMSDQHLMVTMQTFNGTSWVAIPDGTQQQAIQISTVLGNDTGSSMLFFSFIRAFTGGTQISFVMWSESVSVNIYKVGARLNPLRYLSASKISSSYYSTA